MRIQGILKDDFRTRSKLVERPAEQLELLVHVLFCQGRRIELAWRHGSIDGDPALVIYVEGCAEKGRVVPTGPDDSLVAVSLDDWDSIASVLHDVFEPGSVDVEDEGSIPAPI